MYFVTLVVLPSAILNGLKILNMSDGEDYSENGKKSLKRT